MVQKDVHDWLDVVFESPAKALEDVATIEDPYLAKFIATKAMQYQSGKLSQSQIQKNYQQLIDVFEDRPDTELYYLLRLYSNLSLPKDRVEHLKTLISEAKRFDLNHVVLELQLVTADIAYINNDLEESMRILESIELDLAKTRFRYFFVYYLTVGNIYFELADYEKSINSFQQIFQNHHIHPGFQFYLLVTFCLANAKVQAEDSHSAEIILKNAIHRAKDPDPYFLGLCEFKLGQIHSDQGRFSMSETLIAIRHLKQSENAPFLSHARLFLLQNLVEKKRFTFAKAYGECLQTSDLEDDIRKKLCHQLAITYHSLNLFADSHSKHLECYELQTKLSTEAIQSVKSRFRQSFEENHLKLGYDLLESRLNQEVKIKTHSLREFRKLIYSHQVDQISRGKKITETMPVGEGEACIIAFDIQNSSQINDPLQFNFFSKVLKHCYMHMTENYDPDYMMANAYMIKEMGDGFMCSIGFPFKTQEDRYQVAMKLVRRFFYAYCVERSVFYPDREIFCSISVVSGMVSGFFPKIGLKNYDLYGQTLTKAMRLEKIRKEIFQEQQIAPANIITLSKKVYSQIPKGDQKSFQTYSIAKERQQDFQGVDTVYYKVIEFEDISKPKQISSSA